MGVTAGHGAGARCSDRPARVGLPGRSQLESITRAELAERLTGDPPPLVLDVRPAAEFLAGTSRRSRSRPATSPTSPTG